MSDRLVPTWKRVAAGAFAAATCLFALIAANLVAGDPLVDLDTSVAAWLHSHQLPALTVVMLAITHAHAPGPICVYAALMAAVLVKRGQRGWLVALAMAVPVGLVLNVLLKHIFQRARPAFDEPLVSLATYSFPSGHTAGTTLFYGVLAAYLVSRTSDRARRTAWVGGWLGLVALVGFSRAYLGAHYLSDVLAAVAWSLAWLALCLATMDALARRTSHEGRS